MSGTKNWFNKLDESMRKSIRFKNNSIVTSRGMGSILVKKNDGQEVIRCDVLYVLSMARNLIRLVQLLDKDYTMRLGYKKIKVFNGSSNLILKAPLSTNKTSKIIINTLD